MKKLVITLMVSLGVIGLAAIFLTPVYAAENTLLFKNVAALANDKVIKERGAQCKISMSCTSGGIGPIECSGSFCSFLSDPPGIQCDNLIFICDGY